MPVESSTSIPDTCQKNRRPQANEADWSGSKWFDGEIITMRQWRRIRNVEKCPIQLLRPLSCSIFGKFKNTKAATSPIGELHHFKKKKRLASFYELRVSSGWRRYHPFLDISWQWQRFGAKFNYGLLHSPSWSWYENRGYKDTRI